MLKTTGRINPSGARRGPETSRKSAGQGQSWEGRPSQRIPLNEENDGASKSAWEQPTDSIIADMAKGFVAAQAQMACPSDGAGDEILQMLQKISRQLDVLQQPPNTGTSANTNNQGSNASISQNTQSQQPPAQSNSSTPSAELQTLFSQLLTARKQDEPAGTKNSQAENSQAENSGQTQGKPAQTAAQVLAQAQFELSQELDNSLQKLKQVIAESEKVANRIGTLIGKENNSQ